MQALLNWTLEAIREEGTDFSWMEELRFDWTPLVRSAVEKMLEGQTMLVVTDDKRTWFSHYIQHAINAPEKGRPFLPVYNMLGCFPKLPMIRDTQEIALMEDMLELSFPNGYFLWYIGDSRHTHTKFIYRSEENFLWMMNEQIPNSLFLKESDSQLDIKLLQLYRLFDKTVEAVLYGEVGLDG